MSRTMEILRELESRLAHQRRLLGLPKPTQMSTLELLQELLLATARVQAAQHATIENIAQGVGAILDEALPPGQLITPGQTAHPYTPRDQEADGTD